MPLPVVRAHSIAAALSALGFRPRTKHHPDRIRIEVDAPDRPSEAVWRALLAALERGDRFGLETSARGRVAWALVLADASSPHPESGD